MVVEVWAVACGVWWLVCRLSCACYPSSMDVGTCSRSRRYTRAIVLPGLLFAAVALQVGCCGLTTTCVNERKSTVSGRTTEQNTLRLSWVADWVQLSCSVCTATANESHRLPCCASCALSSSVVCRSHFHTMILKIYSCVFRKGRNTTINNALYYYISSNRYEGSKGSVMAGGGYECTVCGIIVRLACCSLLFARCWTMNNWWCCKLELILDVGPSSQEPPIGKAVMPDAWKLQAIIVVAVSPVGSNQSGHVSRLRDVLLESFVSENLDILYVLNTRHTVCTSIYLDTSAAPEIYSLHYLNTT